MSRKAKDDNPLTEAIQSASYIWRHRAGINLSALPFLPDRLDKVKILGKTLHIDNTIPALIEDTFANLGYEQKDGTRPVIAAKRKSETGWHLVIHLPPGVSFSQVKRDRDYFQDATNSWIEMEWKHGKAHMDIQSGQLPECISYQWSPPKNMDLPIPIGYTRTGPAYLDLPEAPHLLVGGSTGGGKTNFIRTIIHSVIENAYVAIIDLKGIDFAYLENKCVLATNELQAIDLLLKLNALHDKRIELLRNNHAVKVQELQEAVPFVVLVVDELAEIRGKYTMELLDRLVRFARASGISVIAASQRTSVQVIPGDTRSNFLARVCFRVGTEADSRVVLGEDCGLAGQLPAIKGRAIYRFGLDLEEVQTMNLPRSRAGELLLQMPIENGRDLIEYEPNTQAKRLSPR